MPINHHPTRKEIRAIAFWGAVVWTAIIAGTVIIVGVGFLPLL